MTMPPEPSGFWQVLAKVVEVFTKPLAVISNAIAERLEIFFRRKPKLHVHFHPHTGVWCLANDGNMKIMQVGFAADFTHDDPRQTLILVDAFPEGAHSKYPFHDDITIGLEELVTPEHQIWMMVTPVVGEEGKNWEGRIVFVDQFKQKHKGKEKFEFMWAVVRVRQPRLPKAPVANQAVMNLCLPSKH
jgi:hypothetical protein